MVACCCDVEPSGFGGKEICHFGGTYARYPSLGKWRNGGTAIALIPLCPGTLVEDPTRGVIQRGFEIIVTEIYLEDFNTFIRGVGHRVGQKALWELQRFFWSAKPEDALGKRLEVRRSRSFALQGRGL